MRATFGRDEAVLPWKVITQAIEVQAIKIEIAEINMEALEWACDIAKFLITKELLCSKEEARKVKNKATHFTMINNALYKQGFSALLL